ncbi:MAG: hypothetical protein WBL87_09295, partial [Methanothrix sp.]
MINKEHRAILLALGLLVLIGLAMSQDAEPLKQETMADDEPALEGTAFGPNACNGEPIWVLLAASDAVSTNLSRIETALIDASIALSKTGIDGPGAREVLSKLTAADSSAIDCITIDTDGIVREVEPESFEGVKGQSLKEQDQVNDTLA